MIFEMVLVSEEGSFQVPESIRDQMDLKPGEKFLMTVSGNSILLKRMIEKNQEEANDFWSRVKEPHGVAV